MLFWDARLIDGSGGAARDDVAIRIADGLIEAIEDIAGRPVPEDAPSTWQVERSCPGSSTPTRT